MPRTPRLGNISVTSAYGPSTLPSSTIDDDNLDNLLLPRQTNKETI